MNDIELENYKAGYWDCRALLTYRLKHILSLPEGHKEALDKLLSQIQEEERNERFRNAQAEHPGLTQEQYEAMCEADLDQIRAKHYSEAGFLKPRLFKS